MYSKLYRKQTVSYNTLVSIEIMETKNWNYKIIMLYNMKKSKCKLEH